MQKKYLSLIIIPHKKGKQRNFTVSKKALQFTAGLAAFAFILLTLFLIDYFLMNGTRSKYRQMMVDYEEQGQLLTQYKESIDSLNSRIQDFERYAKKLNIMAGFKAEDMIKGEPGVGGSSDVPQQAISETQTDLSRLNKLGEKAEGIDKNFDVLNNFFENQTLELAQTPSIMPTQGYWSSSYGWRDDPFTGKRTFHRGVDIATQTGNPVIATADGIVIQTKSDKIGGRTVKISHPKTGFVTVYCHLSKYLVKPGQKIKRGDTIGLIGSTGKAKGPHVHYEVRLDGKSLNPWYYILDY
ncbi:MAG: peptidoglycan DD-metalloendopeptidase family protein [Candidatus Aminicenantes bacterium]|nr:peptidoglycan DD-metalloendopeptidase family protein [Candidatus Aminicenantes bacterium]